MSEGVLATALAHTFRCERGEKTREERATRSCVVTGEAVSLDE